MSSQDANPILISLQETYVPSKQWDMKVSRHKVSERRPASYIHSKPSTAIAVTDVPSGNLLGNDEAGKLEELQVLLVLVKERGSLSATWRSSWAAWRMANGTCS